MGQPATIVGTPQRDKLVGTDGDDVIVGLDGLDNIYGGAGNDLICGGATPYTERYGDQIGSDLSGGPGDDTVVGGMGYDLLYGGEGSDVLMGRRGWDRLWGDSGIDVGQDILYGGAGVDSLTGDGGDDQLYGEGGQDFLGDHDGANLVDGGPGNDHVHSGAGNDVLRGGDGYDWLGYEALLDANGSGDHCNDVVVDLGQGTASGEGFGEDSLEGFEKVATGGGSDTLIGDDGPNVFFPGYDCPPSPTDTVVGNGGRDVIHFSPLVSGSSAPSGVTVNLAEGWADWRTWNRRLYRLSIASVEDVVGTDWRDTIVGNSGSNLLIGGRGYARDQIYGLGGSDRIVGHGGADLLEGGPGRDTLLGGPSNDQIDGGPGRDIIDGGPDTDSCLSPSLPPGAVNCE